MLVCAIVSFESKNDKYLVTVFIFVQFDDWIIANHRICKQVMKTLPNNTGQDDNLIRSKNSNERDSVS